MKEIKFRLPHFKIEDDTFSYFSYWGRIDYQGNSKSDVFTAPTYNNHTYTKEDQQFIGLLDKDGKEVYEGDIVFQTGMGNNIVVYCKEVACFGYRSKTGIKPFSLVPVLKVIGNIYENPELV